MLLFKVINKKSKIETVNNLKQIHYILGYVTMEINKNFDLSDTAQQNWDAVLQKLKNYFISPVNGHLCNSHNQKVILEPCRIV